MMSDASHVNERHRARTQIRRVGGSSRATKGLDPPRPFNNISVPGLAVGSHLDAACFSAWLGVPARGRVQNRVPAPPLQRKNGAGRLFCLKRSVRMPTINQLIRKDRKSTRLN